MTGTAIAEEAVELRIGVLVQHLHVACVTRGRQLAAVHGIEHTAVWLVIVTASVEVTLVLDTFELGEQVTQQIALQVVEAKDTDTWRVHHPATHLEWDQLRVARRVLALLPVGADLALAQV